MSTLAAPAPSTSPPSSSVSPSTSVSPWSPRWILASPWLVVLFCWPATLLAWYYISLVTDPASWNSEFLLKYLVAMLSVDTALCVWVIRRSTRHARAVLAAEQSLPPELARHAWLEALNLPLRTAQLIVALIGITTLPGVLFFALRGEWAVVAFGLTGAAMAGACELTVLFPLVQGSSLPLVRRLKGEHPELRLRDPGITAPPLRAYFAFGIFSLTAISIVLVTTLIHLRAHPISLGSPGSFPELPASLLVVACLGCMAVGIALQLTLSVLMPLRRLTATLARFSSGERGVRVGLLQLGEVGTLGEGFDDMAGALDHSRATVEAREAMLRHSQRFEVMANVTAGFAHEVANPLSTVAANLDAGAGEVEELLQKGTLDAKAAESLKACASALADAAQATEQMTYLLRDMRSFSRRELGDPVSCDVGALVDGAVRIAAGEVRRRGTVTRDYQPVPTVHGSPQRLSQVFLNLLLNAARALPERGGGSVTVAIRPAGTAVEVCVRDNGHGVALEHQARLFEALFTGWPSGEGTGLGLHVSREIVQAHGGSIEYRPAPGGGAEFVVRLPASQSTAAPTGAQRT